MANVWAAHMCRDGHVEIYYNDSEYELCPVCRCRAALGEALDGWEEWAGYTTNIYEKRISALRKEFLDD